jgi:hypothetical protein
MNQEATNNISNVLKELDKTINVIGTERLIEILVYSRKNNIQITTDQILQAENIINVVCEEFEMTLSEFFSAKRKNNRRSAIGVCAMFLQNRVNLDNSNISFILKKPENLTSIYKNEIVSLNSAHPVDRKTLEKITNIKTKLNTLKDEQ